jgi:competence protein ComEA
MSRRDAGTSHTARHARERLQATLGGAGGLLTDDAGQAFEYGAEVPAHGDARAGAVAEDLAGSGTAGPALRWRLGLPVALLLAALAVLAGAWFWVQVAAGQPQVVPLSDVLSQEGTSSGAGGDRPEEPAGQETGPAGQGTDPAGRAAGPSADPHRGGTLVIHVAGAVALPGVVHLPAGSRIHQAIAAAGGPTAAADLNRLNLAAVLADGQKLYVPVPGESIPAEISGNAVAGGNPGSGSGASDGSGSAAGAGKVNLNTAGVEELDALPKVGPVLAQRIVDWRKEHGPFKSVEELDAVDGVGPKMLETLLPLVVV